MSEIQAGFYKGRGVVGSAQLTKAMNGGEQVELELQLAGIDRRVRTKLSFAGKAGPISLERLRALGWKGGSDTSFPGIDTHEVDVEIRYEEWNGKQQMRVEIKTFAPEPMNDKEAGGFMAKLMELDKRTPRSTKPLGSKGYPAELDDVDLG